MPKLDHLRPSGLHHNPAYSHVVTATGARTIYISGQVSVDEEGRIVGEGDIAAQTEQVLANLRIALDAAGASMHDLVSWQLFVVNGVDLTAGYQVAAAALPKDREPPLITVAMVPALGVPGALLELSAIAAVVR